MEEIMKRITFIFFILLLGGPLLGVEWKKYPYHEPGSSIIFPRDEGSHRAVANLEWWYVIFHAKGKITGHDYSILVTHFNNTFRFFTITDLTEKTHESGTTRGKLETHSQHMDVNQYTRYGHDFFRVKKDTKGTLIPFEYELETHYTDMYLKADLVALRPPMMVMKNGHFQVGKSGKTYYYSLTRLKAQGILTYHGITEPFEASAWIDHQWGPFFVSPIEIGKLFESYEWFCMQLDDGSDIMLINIYDRNFRLPQTSNYGAVEILDVNNLNQHTSDRKFKRQGYWQDPVSGHIMSMGWTLDVVDWDLSLNLEPDFYEQMVKMPLNGDFWEGSISVKGYHKGQYVTGRAFGELIHRFQIPVVKITTLKKNYHLNEMIKLKFKIINPDEGNPLKFRIYSFDGNNQHLLKEINQVEEVHIMASDLIAVAHKKSYQLKVEALSVDESIVGVGLSQNFKIE